jgi:hypothetical protein
MRKDRLKIANVHRKEIQDLDVTSALNRFMDEKEQSKSKPQSSNQFAENIGVTPNDEFGSLLQSAIKKLRTDPNDLNAKITLDGMNLFYKWENLNVINGELDSGNTYYDLINNNNNNELNNQPPEENPIYDDGEPEPGDFETFEEAQAARDEDQQFRASSSVEDAKEQAWLSDTTDSPAAKAGLDDTLRLQARRNYEDFLKKRNVKSSLGKARG